MTTAGLRARVLILAALLALGFTGLTGRLAWLQIVRRADLAQLAERQYSRTVVLPGLKSLRPPHPVSVTFDLEESAR